jgi:hypothetical protein
MLVMFTAVPVVPVVGIVADNVGAGGVSLPPSPPQAVKAANNTIAAPAIQRAGNLNFNMKHPPEAGR